MTSEKKMQIVIDNYFKSECNVDTSIRDAFEKGFRIGVQKTVYRPKGEWIRVGHDIYECSLCHQNVMTKDIDCYSYCHRCGVRMQNGFKSVGQAWNTSQERREE